MIRPLKIDPSPTLHAVAPEARPPAPHDPHVVAERRLGALLVKQGRLSLEQVNAVLEHQRQAPAPRPFGQCAIELGLLSQPQVDHAIAIQHDSLFVPEAERHLFGRDLVVLHEPFSAQAEALRGVRSQLAMRWFDDQLEKRALAVVSPATGDGRTHVCANLAILFAQLGEPTLIVDADLRGGCMHRLFGIDNAVGLSSHLSRRTTAAPIRAVPGIDHLHLLPCGPLPPNPQELLSRAQFALLLEELAHVYAYILIDTPAAARHGESATVAVRASGCLMVVRRNRTRIAEAQVLADGLGKLSAQVIGAVVNEH